MKRILILCLIVLLFLVGCDSFTSCESTCYELKDCGCNNCFNPNPRNHTCSLNETKQCYDECRGVK